MMPHFVTACIPCSRRIGFHASAFLLAACSVAIAQKQPNLTHDNRRVVDSINVALKKEETRTLISGDLGSNIYLNTASVVTGEPGSPVTLAWIVFPHDRVAFRTCRINKIGPANNLYESYSPKRALALINGGFYGFNGENRETPLGLLISDGQQLSPIVNSWKSGGVIVQRNTDAEIVPISQKDKLGNPSQALQSKPLLIEKGLLAVKTNANDEPFNRSAIGLTDKGDIVVAAAVRSDNQALTLYDFGRFLTLLKSVKGISIKVALNLDGATDSHLYIVSPAQHFGYVGSNYVPSALAIVPR